MPVSREKWPYLQVADGIAARITAGEPGYQQGDKLPSLQVIAAQEQVSHETAHRAVALLRSRKLVTTIPRTGSFVGAPREVPGPQQVLSGMRWPAAEQITVTAAEYIPAPEYIAPVLGVTPYGPGGVAWVIRREQVLSGALLPVPVLTVSWFPGEFAEPVPELLSPAPLAPGEAAELIAAATGRRASAWRVSFETRPILHDGREVPLTGLDPDAYVQAITYTWADARSVIEYGEYVLGPGLVTTAGGILEAPA